MNERLDAEQIKKLSIADKVDLILVKLEKLDPIVETYDGFILGKRFVVGAGTIISSIVALGALVLWVLKVLHIHS